jgi:hypothetical protein
MITGAHSIIYSKNPDTDRVFFRDILKFPNVDVGEGWLIFGLPPAEIAIHPSKKDNIHELFLMCDDIKQFTREMKKHKITCSAVRDQGWGLLIKITLPGGGTLGVYQPMHARPKSLRVIKPVKKNS